MEAIFGVDIGGTNIKIGKFVKGELVEYSSIKTNKEENGKYIMSEIFEEINKMLGEDTIIGLGMGVPGPVVNGVLLKAPNLGWEPFDVVERIREEYGDIYIKVTNDANLATIGEHKLGGGIGFKNFVFITIGTGIGGGVILDNELHEGVTGAAGEIGHIRVDFRNRRKCNCGLYDCVERYASATGLVITAQEKIPGRNTSLTLENLSSKTIFDEAKKGDEVALEIVDDMVEKLATALSQIASTINPEAFVIGGGVSKAGDFLIDKLAKRFQKLAFFPVRNTQFRLATLGNDAGMYGGYYIIKKEIEKDRGYEN
ncbi:MAG TPA: ROK family protein [Bacilli bacterium]|nr:ROK family protein [Bacilli bacterium]